MNVESFSSAWRGNLSCEECSTRLNVFRRKKTCYFCRNSFCQVCITRREDKKFCCRKCQILTARPLDRSKLLKLKNRDLINYLTSRQIPTNGCVEKEDLVNVLIKAVNNSCFYPASTACSEGSAFPNSYPNSPRNSSNSETLSNDGIRITGHSSTENELNGGQYGQLDTTPFIPQETNETEQIPDFSGIQDSQEDIGEDAACQNSASFNSYLPESSQNSGLPLNKPLMLSDIKSQSDLDALSVKQLKELLMRNRTDFKGCVERAELIQKASRLWSDYTDSRKGDGCQAGKRQENIARLVLLLSLNLENLSLEELCKICMDAPIECVLLECGHMATCTSCGKQLCECPICRQFVVRCVRTYKA